MRTLAPTLFCLLPHRTAAYGARQALVIGLLLTAGCLNAQGGTVRGEVTDADGEALIGAYVQLVDTEFRAVSDAEGVYRLAGVPYGEYTLRVRSLGFRDEDLALRVDRPRVVADARLTPDAAVLAGATVRAKSRAGEVSELPITITSLDAERVAERALGAEELLKRSAGVVVRRRGGLGSAVNVNLNGLTGQAVRVYYDGIPLELFGGGLQLNTIPVDALARVDVYKGVLPVTVGTDALGGGINLVPKAKTVDHLNASYTVGSFNTHRLTLNGRRKLSERWALSLLAYYNYSDNDFTMPGVRSITERKLENGTTVIGPEETVDARRFHDRHRSAFAQATLSVRGLKWADRLALSVSAGGRDDQIQHGAFLFNTAVGRATRADLSFVQRLDYRKSLLNDRLSLRYFGTLATMRNRTRDSTTAVFNWRGERLQTADRTGAELFALPTDRTGNDLGTAHRLTAAWTLREGLRLNVSEFYGYLRVKGEDPAGRPLMIGGEPLDPNTVPSVLRRNVLGGELAADFGGGRGTVLGFYKNYLYAARSIDILQRGATRLPLREVSAVDHGVGLAVKYRLSARVFVRSSFERAVRLPNEREVFGDFGAVLPNYTLQPERSNNLNVGMQYERPGRGERGALRLRLNGFVRDQQDLIRAAPFGPENSRFVNEAAVRAAGGELTADYQPLARLRLNGNFTYQRSLILPPDGVGAGPRVAVPNVPQLFYNASARYTFPDVGAADNDLELFWTYFFTDRFSINEVADLDRANPDFIIPAQNLHEAGLTYRLPKPGLTVSGSLQNVFDARVFDNFRIPRPGRNYQLKIGYTIR